MAELNFHLADVQDIVKDEHRAFIAGLLGAWMWKVVERVPQFSSVSIGWTTKSGRPSLGPTDILIYFTSDPQRSAIKATGGDVSEPILNDSLLGYTNAYPDLRRAISEVYWKRAIFPREGAGAAFHEAAHNKSLQGNEMHNGRDGLLVAAPVWNLDPTPANLDFLAGHLGTAVQQILVTHGTLTKDWYR
jgi:hypothetical protein